MIPKKPGALDTAFFAGMYDPEELIGWIERQMYSPAESDRLIPLCVTPGNCEFVLHLIATRLGVRYLRCLERYLGALTDESLKRAMDYPTSQHYIRNGSVDPKYSDGVRALRDYVLNNGYLENRFGTFFFRGMYDPEELIGWLQRLNYLPAQTESLIPLCVTEDNCGHVIRLIYEKLGIEHLDLLNSMISYSDCNILRFEKEFPASQHYNLDGNVDPEFIYGIESLKNFIKVHESLRKNL